MRIACRHLDETGATRGLVIKIEVDELIGRIAGGEAEVTVDVVGLKVFKRASRTPQRFDRRSRRNGRRWAIGVELPSVREREAEYSNVGAELVAQHNLDDRAGALFSLLGPVRARPVVRLSAA